MNYKIYDLSHDKEGEVIMKQYLKMGQRLLDEGRWIENARTGKRTLTVIGDTFTHDFGRAFPGIENDEPLDHTSYPFSV